MVGSDRRLPAVKHLILCQKLPSGLSFIPLLDPAPCLFRRHRGRGGIPAAGGPITAGRSRVGSAVEDQRVDLNVDVHGGAMLGLGSGYIATSGRSPAT